jgi:site-specific DNA recombinase
MKHMSRTRAVAYLRVSTDKQADAGVSLDAQRAKVEQYAALYDLELVEVIVDAGVSAKTLDRPGLTRALDMLRRGKADALLVAKLDRLTRSVRDLGDLLERVFAHGKAGLLSVGEQIDTRTAAGRMMLNILASVAQWERETIGERTAAAMAHKAACGEFTGGEAPYGYRVENGRLVEVASEQAVIGEARRLRASGLSLRATAGELDRAGLRARTGKAFAPTQIARMVAA